jgi:hypothetical protein
MLGQRGMLSWILRRAVVTSLLGALWIAAPAPTFARPADISPGPAESGDPTADEQPSPTPKPKARAVQVPTASQGTSHETSLGRIVTVRISWEIYRLLLTRYWVR